MYFCVKKKQNVYVILVSCVKKKEFLVSRLIAHRGIQHPFLENTLPAFEKAIEKNKIIELDVHLSKDHEVIVFHDNSLKRLFGINRDIQDLTLAEIKKYRYIPTLKEVLNLVQGRVPVLIEFKMAKPVGVLEQEASKLLDQYSGEFAVQSFNPLSLLWFRLNRSHYIRGYLVHSIFPDNFLLRFFLNQNLIRKIIKPDYIGVNLAALKLKKIDTLRKKYLIIGYTLKNVEDYQEYFKLADNFICDIFLDKKQETVPLRTVSQKE